MQEQEVAQAESTEEPDGEAVDTGIVDAVDAQRHIDKLNMDEERAAAKKAT
jgi:hypothetical protein